MPWNTTQVEIRLFRAQREQDHHHHVAEIELCVKEQKGEQEAKAKENQRLADENFGNSRWPFCEHQYQHIARQPGQNIHIISKYAMSDQDCLLHDQLGLRIGKVRSILWNLMEYPETSRTAQVFLIYICTQSIERLKSAKSFPTLTFMGFSEQFLGPRGPLIEYLWQQKFLLLQCYLFLLPPL